VCKTRRARLGPRDRVMKLAFGLSLFISLFLLLRVRRVPLYLQFYSSYLLGHLFLACIEVWCGVSIPL
jgi:hypothetical protein